jgi:CRISPR-associated protein Csd1
MILQALQSYYLRKQDDLAPEGFEVKEIPFLIVVDYAGQFLDLQDTRTLLSGKKLVARRFLVPSEEGRSGKNAWLKANLLWDHYGYVLKWPKSDDDSDKDMAIRQHGSFVEKVKILAETFPINKEIQAVYNFLKNGQFEQVFTHPVWGECKKISGCNLTFLVQDNEGNTHLVCETDDVRVHISATGPIKDKEEDEGDGGMEGLCLITGERSQIARLHPRTPILGAKSNAKIVSFQKNMGFDSYGKEQSYNAPVSRSAAFAYTTTLNHLLSKPSRQKLLMGDSTAVFWAEKKHDFEDIFADIFGEPAKENPVQDYKNLISLFRAPETGSKPEIDPNTRFYVLGLAPNAARIAVRFWYNGTVKEVADNIYQHFEDCSIVHGPNQPETLSLFRLLVSTAVQGEAKNIQPNLAGEFMRAILMGTPYPRTVLAAVINRTKAEQSKKDVQGRTVPNVTYPRSALIKAVLVRYSRYYNRNFKEVNMSLDKTNFNIGYRLGRLFAVLEKVQEEANPGINATIRDRFYGAASSTPVAVFSHLMKLKNHHISKLENRGRAVNFERIIGEIVDGIDGFSPHLSLPDQGRFAVGYYHQRQDFFTKKDDQHI